jgi:predicted AAA+ superfamily ATPase
MGADMESLLERAHALMTRLEAALPAASQASVDWKSAVAFRWQRGKLVALAHTHKISLSDLCEINDQKRRIEQNTRQFVAKLPANNVLLTGARGTGKSSLVKALLNKYSAGGLRVIEVGKEGLSDLSDIIALIAARPERFILYCDDLSFNTDEPGYQALKAVLDGSFVALPENLLIYATSNRRHLMPEYMEENLATQHTGDEVHPAEAVEEKVSLSERFGLWVSFYPFSQDEYLNIVAHWLKHFDPSIRMAERVERAALQWSQGRGARNGRVACQFARDWVGSERLNQR